MHSAGIRDFRIFNAARLPAFAPKESLSYFLSLICLSPPAPEYSVGPPSADRLE
jgi:hypothetical protein